MDHSSFFASTRRLTFNGLIARVRALQPRMALLIVLIISLLSRMAVAFYLGDVIDAPSLLTDQRSYHALGARLVEGHGFSFDRPWYPFGLQPDAPTAHWSFLYSLAVAAVYAVFGVHPLAVRVLQAILGGVALPLMVHALAGVYFPNRPGLRPQAALLAACYAYFVLYATTVMTETTYIVLLIWSLMVSLRIDEALRAGRPVPKGLLAQLGLSLGLAALVRQSILPWVPVLFLWLLGRAWRGGQLRRTLVGLVAAGLILLALIAPWTYRNFRVYGRFLLLNSNTGYALYSAQHPLHGTTFQEFAAMPLPPDLPRTNEAEMDRALLREGVQFVLDDPVRYLRLCLSRVRAYLEFWPTPDTTLLHNIGRVASAGIYLPFMLVGAMMIWRDRELAERTALIWLFAAFYSLLHILTWAMVRYRLPVDAVMMPVAALAVERLYRRVLWPLYVRAAPKSGNRTSLIRQRPLE
jgi:hypothetical protein